MILPFRPIAREAAAELLSVSLRAIDYYIEQGLLPPPISLGGRRRYWHPDAFYEHLHAILRGPKSAPNAAAPGRGSPAVNVMKSPTMRRTC